MMPLRRELNDCVDNMQAVTGLSWQETISSNSADEIPFQTGLVIFQNGMGGGMREVVPKGYLSPRKYSPWRYTISLP